MKLLKNQSGFTLIELVLIIVVLGILAAVAIVQFGSITTDAKNAALDGAVGPYSAQVAIAVNTLRAMPVSVTAGGGADNGCSTTTSGTTNTWEDCVYYDVVHSGSGITRGALYSAAFDNFPICTGTTCTYTTPANIAANGAVPSGVTCDAGERYVVLDFQSSGAIFVSAKTDC